MKVRRTVRRNSYLLNGRDKKKSLHIEYIYNNDLCKILLCSLIHLFVLIEKMDKSNFDYFFLNVICKINDVNNNI